MLEADQNTIDQLHHWGLYADDISTQLSVRGLNPDFTDDGASSSVPNSEGTALFKRYMAQKMPTSIMGKIQAISLKDIPYDDKNLRDELDYKKHFRTYTDLCSIFTKIDNRNYAPQYHAPGYEYYPDDFVYVTKCGYPLNRLITLRRFPYPCMDNIFDEYQKDSDVTRMVTYFDNNMNKLEDILGFSYGLNWKELQAGYEAMQMQGSDNEGLTGYMKKTAVIFGDEELIKNRLRGPNGNMVSPDHDANKAHGPVDSITTTHIRDVGLNFDKEFSLKFEYSSRSLYGRNPDAVMKDIIANILLCTFNDGEFWGGARYWVGARPSKSLNLFQWMNSDDPNKILQGAWNSLTSLVQKNFGTKESRLETLKKVLKGGIQMAMAGILNFLGRPGIPYSNSLLSGAPVGMWHLTIGHPMNPIMTIGNLICTGVDINFPDDSLSYGDFPTYFTATVKLKPAMPRDRAGIEMMFNHGQQRIYVPAVAKVYKNEQGDGRHRAELWDYVTGAVDKTANFIGKVEDRETYETLATGVSDFFGGVKNAVADGAKLAADSAGDVWTSTKKAATNGINTVTTRGDLSKVNPIEYISKSNTATPSKD